MTDQKAARARLWSSPFSPFGRAVNHYVTEFDLPVDITNVDFSKGDHKTAAFTAVNPVNRIPALVDGDFHLSESSAILKYLAERFGKDSHFPKDPKQRAIVASRIETIQTDLVRFYLPNLIFAQLFAAAKRSTEAHQKVVVELGKTQALRQFAAFDQDFLSQTKYLCGDEITVADFFALSMMWSAHGFGCDLKGYKNLSAWWDRMTATKSYKAVYGPVTDFSATFKGKFVTFTAKEAETAVEQYLAESKDKPVAAAAADKFKPKAGKVTYYYIAGSPPARGVLHWLNESGNTKEVELVMVDVKAGEHKSSEYRRIHPRGLVPALVDGDLTLTESAAILRYLAIKFKCPSFPANDLRARARVNEVMGWFNSGLYTLLAYHSAFPQCMAAQLWSGFGKAEAEWALPRLRNEISQLENVWLKDNKTGKGKKFLLGGDAPSIADFFGWSMIGVGWLVGQDLSDHLNISRWDRSMNALKSTAATLAPVNAFLAMEVWGPRKDKVAVRPLPGHYVRVWNVSINKADIDAFLAISADLTQQMRGEKGVRRVEAAIDRDSARFTTIVEFINKAAWVNHSLSEKTEENHRKTHEATAKMMDHTTSITIDGHLLDA